VLGTNTPVVAIHQVQQLPAADFVSAWQASGGGGDAVVGVIEDMLWLIAMQQL
jgi:hypothetical protein